MPPSYPNVIINQLIAGYGEMLVERIDAGWKPDFISVTFTHLQGNDYAVGQIMEEEVRRLYRKFVTRVVRNARTCPAAELPMWICVPDYPIYKVERQHIAFVRPNAGRHFHILAATPPWSRLKDPLWMHFDTHQGWYRGEKIWEVDARPIKDRAEFVTDYAFKNTKTRRVKLDEVIILPVASSEVPPRRR